MTYHGIGAQGPKTMMVMVMATVTVMVMVMVYNFIQINLLLQICSLHLFLLIVSCIFEFTNIKFHQAQFNFKYI